MDKFMAEFTADRLREPVYNVGAQVRLWPKNLSDLTVDDIEYFFNREQGVLDITGHPKESPKTEFYSGALKGVPQIFYKPSGEEGLAKFLEPPVASISGGLPYFEGVTMSVILALWSFHGSYNRRFLGKLSTVVFAGDPNQGKTKEAQVALLIASDIVHLYSKGTTPEGLRDVGCKYSLLQVVDDNDSIKKVFWGRTSTYQVPTPGYWEFSLWGKGPNA